MCDMCHHLIERKSKVMDKRIRKSKEANSRVTCGKMRLPLDFTAKQIQWGGEEEEEGK